MTTDAVARWLEVPRTRVQLWLRSGKLPGVKVSGQWRVPLDAVLELERRDRLRGRSRRLDPRYQEDDMARTIADDELSAAFWALADEQVGLLRPHGQGVFTQPRQVLFQQGDPSRDFYVVLEGVVELVEPTGSTARSLGLRRRHEIVDELNLMSL